MAVLLLLLFVAPAGPRIAIAQTGIT